MNVIVVFNLHEFFF